MTPAEAYDATRDKLASIIHAHAAADKISLSIGQIYGLLDTAFEQTGFRTLCAVVQAADSAAQAYAGTYAEVPDDVVAADTEWTGQRAQLADYPNLAELVSS